MLWSVVARHQPTMRRAKTSAKTSMTNATLAALPGAGGAGARAPALPDRRSRPAADVRVASDQGLGQARRNRVGPRASSPCDGRPITSTPRLRIPPTTATRFVGNGKRPTLSSRPCGRTIRLGRIRRRVGPPGGAASLRRRVRGRAHRGGPHPAWRRPMTAGSLGLLGAPATSNWRAPCPVLTPSRPRSQQPLTRSDSLCPSGRRLPSFGDSLLRSARSRRSDRWTHLLDEDNRRAPLGLAINWGLRVLLAYAAEMRPLRSHGPAHEDCDRCWLHSLLATKPESRPLRRRVLRR